MLRRIGSQCLRGSPNGRVHKAKGSVGLQEQIASKSPDFMMRNGRYENMLEMIVILRCNRKSRELGLAILMPQ